jgi:hypothetical protein
MRSILSFAIIFFPSSTHRRIYLYVSFRSPCSFVLSFSLFLDSCFLILSFSVSPKLRFTLFPPSAVRGHLFTLAPAAYFLPLTLRAPLLALCSSTHPCNHAFLVFGLDPPSFRIVRFGCRFGRLAGLVIPVIDIQHIQTSVMRFQPVLKTGEVSFLRNAPDHFGQGAKPG